MEDKINKFNALFIEDKLNDISKSDEGFRFLLSRSMDRKEIALEFIKQYSIVYDENYKDYTSIIFMSDIKTVEIENFVREYARKNKMSAEDREYLKDQLSRLKSFDWGGTYQNALEKTIVNNFVKKYKSFETINEHIKTTIFNSVQGYTLSSWYNHWSTTLVEDLFSDIDEIIPAIGKIEKIDFFINKIPFDLKITYFPDEFMKCELKSKGFGVELTQIKKACKKANISIPDDLSNKRLKEHLYIKLSESENENAKIFIDELRALKIQIINECIRNPIRLKRWLYENQGEKRFDASNRFFIVLVDKTDLYNSWKLKRNFDLILNEIKKKIKYLSCEKMNFFWKKEQKEYEVISDILFIVREE